ncbi:MAG: TolC family protein [Chlorobi bacterium]|nr:TolC family protein [Chlorobiota bacterium]
MGINILKFIQTRLLIAGAFLFLFSGTNTFAQGETKTLTLEDAVIIARDQSPDALKAKHGFRRSYWQFRRYKASYLPALTLTGTLPNFDRSIQRISLQEGEVLSERQYAEYTVNAALRQRIGFTGGELFLQSGVGRLDNFTDTTTITQYISTPINIGYSQPIFKYNSYKWEKRLEPLMYREAEQKYLEDMEQVSITASNYFFNLLLQQIKEKIALISQANYDTIYKIAVGRYTLGKIAENELLQLELRHLQANSAVEEARLNTDNAVFQFKSFLRIKDDMPIELLPPYEFTPFIVEYTKALEMARINNSRSLGFERRLVEAESDVDRAKMDGRFDADLYAVYGLTQSAIVLDEVYKNPVDQQQLRLGITMPILDWGVARGNIKMAESQQELVRTAVEQEQTDFDQEIFLNIARFNMQFQQVKIAAKADTVAQKSYNITKARYMIGKISVTDLNIAQTETDNSKSAYINALRTYWNFYYQIRKLTLFDFEHNRPITVNYKELL